MLTICYLLVDSLAINYVFESAFLQSHHQTSNSFSDQDNVPLEEEETENEDGNTINVRNQDKTFQYRKYVLSELPTIVVIDLLGILGKPELCLRFAHLPEYYTHLSLYNLF